MTIALDAAAKLAGKQRCQVAPIGEGVGSAIRETVIQLSFIAELLATLLSNLVRLIFTCLVIEPLHQAAVKLEVQVVDQERPGHEIDRAE